MRGLIYSVLACCMLLVSPCSVAAQDTKPRLVVNIVVGSLRSGVLERYADGFGEGGFKRLMREGVTFTDAEYDYSLTTTEAGLATIATGAQPSVHGIIGGYWWNHVDGTREELVADKKSHPVPFSTGSISCSAHRMHAPTLGDMVMAADPRGKQVTVAVDPHTAIVLNGRSGVAYWVERNKTYWTTSSAYLDQLPVWVARYNSEGTNSFYGLGRWTPVGDVARYLNDEVAVVEGIKGKSTKLLSDVSLTLDDSAYGAMCYTPAGNKIVLKFAAQVVAHEGMGSDDAPDVLNISLDTPRYIAEVYGPESIEYEDMLYRLDADLAEFLSYVYAQVGSQRQVLVVLTSDHGTSPSYNPQDGHERERFNHRQMEVIVNAFLGARYGSGNYLLGFANNALYLDHEYLHGKKLNIASIQEEVATFLLQLRGVSSAMSATALRNTSFGEGRMRLMQQSYHATRSGDVVIDFMPGWMVESGDYRSTSHAGYRYDRSVPLIMSGAGIVPQRITRTVSMTVVAPTTAALVGVESPWATSERPIVEFNSIK
ncbi:MAG: alkaline phosphatase family protein [Alistipes sp.]|nr:alkaline phosphatase family protein [Alistipes sp.]